MNKLEKYMRIKGEIDDAGSFFIEKNKVAFRISRHALKFITDIESLNYILASKNNSEFHLRLSSHIDNEMSIRNIKTPSHLVIETSRFINKCFCGRKVTMSQLVEIPNGASITETIEKNVKEDILIDLGFCKCGNIFRKNSKVYNS